MMMFFVSTCKVALPAQEEQRTDLLKVTNTKSENLINSTNEDTQTNENNNVSVRDERFDVWGFPGTTPFGA